MTRKSICRYAISFINMSSHRFPRPAPGSLAAGARMPGGIRIPIPAGRFPGPRAALTFLAISTRALARPMAGVTQWPQLHCMPCQANLPMLAPQAVLGHIKRPDKGASPEPSVYESEPSFDGNMLDRIHFIGCRKICAHSVSLLRFSCSCEMMYGLDAIPRLSM